jgi:hypothetical protein
MSLPQKFTWLFPGQSPTDLKADPFLGNHILQDVPDWIFREAERWPHPWQFLLGVRRLPLHCYDLFQAAESASRAMNRAQNMSFGGATLQRDLPQEMQMKAQVGDIVGATKIAKKIVVGMVRHGLWRDQANEPAVFKEWRTQAEAGLQKRYGKKFKPWPVKTAAEQSHDVQIMICNWLRWGCAGDPGLCFYSDQAMANLLAALSGNRLQLNQMDVRLAYFRKLRQRLDLRHAFYRKPIVIKARRVSGTGQIEITLRDDKRTFPHRLSDSKRMVIGGRQYYPIPTSGEPSPAQNPST